MFTESDDMFAAYFDVSNFVIKTQLLKKNTIIKPKSIYNK